MNIAFYESPYKPEDVHYDASRFSVLERHLSRLITEKKIISANFCLSRFGKVFARGAIGPRIASDLSEAELRPDTPGIIASISKIFTSTAIFKLMEDGLLRGNQPAAEILPEMAHAPFNKITIAQLLSHTSGLYPDDNCFCDPYRLTTSTSAWAWTFGAFPECATFVEALLHGGMLAAPGEQWAYCTAGFMLLGEIISRVTGMNCAQYLAEKIFKPLGMHDTCTELWGKATAEESARLQNISDRANYSVPWSRKLLQTLAMYTPEEKILPPTGGGIISTTDDLVTFGNMLLNNGTSFDGVRIIGEIAAQRMHESYTPQSIKDYCWDAGGAYRPYALGPDIRRSPDNLFSPGSYFHEGAGACDLVIDPATQFVAAWFVPFADDNWYPEPLYNTANVIWSGIRSSR